MSSTARGTIRDPRDFYPTPIGAFEPLLARLPRTHVYYDPCEGDGRLVSWMKARGLIADGNDLFPSNGKPAIDFLTDKTPRDVITTNPPFSIAQPFANHAIDVAQHVLLLLPLNFLGSEDRKTWWNAHKPAALLVLSKRPSFAMSSSCKAEIIRFEKTIPCQHNWMLPVEAARPKTCPKCGSSNIRISTSDSCNYGWFYWGKGANLFTGLHFL